MTDCVGLAHNAGMLARYKIYRGSRPRQDPLPDGIRKDTRWRRKHILSPSEELVKEYLADPNEAAWRKFKREYSTLLERRFKEDRSSFVKFAQLAIGQDVFIGCSCPTKTNPDVSHCHTYFALQFMKKKFPELHVVLPKA